MSTKTPEELARAREVAARIEAEFKMKDYHKQLRNARITLIVIGSLQILIGLWEAFGPMKLMLGLYIDGGIGVLFFGLYTLSKSNPMPSVLAGLIIYLSLHIFLAVLNPVSIFNGIILKGIMITLLVMGVIAASKVPKVRQNKEELLDEIN